MKPPGRIAVLSSRRAAGADPASRRRTTPAQLHRNALAFARSTIFAAIAHAFGCSAEGGAPAAPAAPSDEQRAAALLDPGARLPPRAETVALADAVAIASSRAGAPAQAASLAELAGDLRVRLFRFDQAATDAREAMELYAAAATAFRASADPAHVERACQAERRRALLAGELARDAAVSYRELYLVSRRYAALAPPAPSAGAPPRSPCLGAIAVALAQAAAYRPSGEALRALEQEGHRVEGIALALAHGPVPAPSAAPASAASAESDAPVQVTAADAGGGDLVVAPRATAPSGPVKITAIERHGSDKGARVVVALSGPTTFDVGTLPADESAGKDARVFVDIAGATSRGIAREIEVGGALRRVRVGVQPKGTRVVLDLAPDLYRRVFYLPDPFRIVIDVSTRPPVRDDERKPGGAREVRRVAIDPGHGGNDTGAVGPTGLKEKDVTLDVAHRVAPLLARELKIETLLTRDSDVYVPLELRTARANAFHADLFVSIHCNASDNGRARGVQTFSLAPSRDAEAQSAKLAARENAARARAGQGVGPGDPGSSLEVEAILSNLNVGDMAARSRHFAELLQRASLASLAPRYPDTKDQGVKGAGFFVLAGADMPAALFETAFISNPEDEARLATADFRQKMADAIVNAIRAYREGK
ncbi:N-acetylmuramoyl-L-alanine amidase [Sorangium sp. So ce315]|uniref:N-acetylmuramoyl-L-alanine amidase n=1 Tax=Sorangium sp. So ce315 TaxID=3133299 RepID=UPI003F63BF24